MLSFNWYKTDKQLAKINDIKEILKKICYNKAYLYERCRIIIMQEDLQIGDIYKGKVINVKPYGAFVSFGNNRKGLIHISHISDSFVNDINDFICQGDKLNVKILNIDKNGKIALTIKDVEQDPKQAEENDQFQESPRRTYFDSTEKAENKKPKTLDELIKDFNRQSNDRQVDINRRLKR